MRRTLTALALLTAGVLASAAGFAEDFTFYVPVELHNIPADIKTFSVSVAVYDRAPDSRGYRPEESRIGYGSSLYGNMSTIPIVNGEFVDTVVVKFNAIPRRQPELATLYEVHLLLQGPPGYQGGALVAMALDGPYPYDPTKPIQYFLTGPIHPPVQMKQIPREIRKVIR